MKNQEIADILYQMADMLEILNVQWKPVAYRKAARNIETLSEDIEKVYRKGGEDALMEIPSIGEGIAKKIIEYLDKGRIAEYEELKRKIPGGVEDVMNVEGLGPKKAWRLYKELGIDGLGKLEKAAREGRISRLEGFGEKSEKDILRGLEFVKKSSERMLLGKALPIAQEISRKLKRLKEVEKVDVAGSIRRRKETIGDIDILVISRHPAKVMDFFTRMENVEHVVAKGGTKSTVMLKEGIECDIRVLEAKSYGAALNYFTGSKDHNVMLRQIAISKGWKLSEYGLFSAKTGKHIAGRTEQDLYAKLGMDYIEPEMRENMGEIGLAQKKSLPAIIKYNSIRGDLHMHTKWTDGVNSTEQMAGAAAKMGYEYIAITDHSKSTYVAGGLDGKNMVKRLSEIDSVRGSRIKILKGAEIDINKDGSLDFRSDVLKQMDIRLAAVHSRFKSPKEEMTLRIVKAMQNPYTNILCHPTGRLINRREPYQADMEKIFQAAKDNNVALEINAQPQRLDLKDLHIKQALEMGCKFAISTDSHTTDSLRFMEFGIAQARRGWLTEKDVINAWPLSKLEKFLGKR